MRKALNLKEVPDYTTICKDVKKLLEERAKLLSVKLEVLAIDSTGLREDNACFYYAKRSGKKRKSWRKLTIVVDTDSNILSVNISIDQVTMVQSSDRYLKGV